MNVAYAPGACTLSELTHEMLMRPDESREKFHEHVWRVLVFSHEPLIMRTLCSSYIDYVVRSFYGLPRALVATTPILIRPNHLWGHAVSATVTGAG